MEAVAVTVGSVAGLWARIGCESLTYRLYDSVNDLTDASLFVDMLGNTLGCWFAGFCFGLQQRLRARGSHLYIGLLTGFCGSMTTFGGWMESAALVVLQDGGAIARGLAMLLIGWWMSLGACSLGIDAAYAVCYLNGPDANADANACANSDAHTDADAGAYADASADAADPGSAAFVGEPAEVVRVPVRNDDAVPSWPCVCVQIVLITTTAVLAGVGLRFDIGDNSAQRRSWYLGTFLAPLGALLRLALSKRLNHVIAIDEWPRSLVMPDPTRAVDAQNANANAKQMAESKTATHKTEPRAKAQTPPTDEPTQTISLQLHFSHLSRLFHPKRTHMASQLVVQAGHARPNAAPSGWLALPFAGTWCCNALGCLINGVLALLKRRIEFSADSWSSVGVGAVQTGLTGCLTTVSAFVVEVYVLHAIGQVWVTHLYIAASFGAALLLSLVFSSGL